MAKDLIAGCFGGVGIVAVGHPFDTIKVNILECFFMGWILYCARLQTQSRDNPLYKNMTDCVKKTIKWEGVSGFYKGFISPLWGMADHRL